MPPKTINQMLRDRFEARFADAAVRHFTRMVQDFQQREWEDANAKAGRFVEAVLKALWRHSGEVVPTGRAFSAGNIMDRLAGKMNLTDSLRLTIPRACRFAYDVASNRGARHDADEIEANEMDAAATLPLCSWILAEMVRYSQHGMDLDEAKAIVDGLTKKRYPFIEEIDGRVYVDIAKSAREAALLILWHIYPDRMNEEALRQQLVRHQYSPANASMAVNRIQGVVDNDGGLLKLRSIGLQEAERMIEQAQRD